MTINVLALATDPDGNPHLVASSVKIVSPTGQRQRRLANSDGTHHLHRHPFGTSARHRLLPVHDQRRQRRRQPCRPRSTWPSTQSGQPSTAPGPETFGTPRPVTINELAGFVVASRHHDPRGRPRVTVVSQPAHGSAPVNLSTTEPSPTRPMPASLAWTARPVHRSATTTAPLYVAGDGQRGRAGPDRRGRLERY